MAFWDRWIHGRAKSPPGGEPLTGAKKKDPAAVATFNDKNITYSGDLASYDYDSILRDKQRNIVQLYELSDYFVDSDPIFRGIIKHVYTPFSLADDYR